MMRKITVYLDEHEAEGLRRLAAAPGESQSELIREGVRWLLREAPERTFHSMENGKGAGEPRPRWGADALREKTLGRQRGGRK